MALKALVLAAGKSARIASVAQELPKPLLEIKGTPVLVHNLKLLADYEITQVWINLHYQAHLIQERIGNGKEWGVSLTYSYEKELLGTAGAVKKLAKELSDGTFLVLYGDNFTNCNLRSLVEVHNKSKAMGTIAVFDQKMNVNSGIAGSGIHIKENGTVTDFKERNDSDSSSKGYYVTNGFGNFVNAGIYALQPEIIQHIPDGFSDFGKDIFPSILKQGFKIAAYAMEGYCLGLDTPESYAQAQKIVSSIQ